MLKCIFAVLFLLVLTAPVLAQGVGNNCGIRGIWYGGAGYQYLTTITPTGAGNYHMESQFGFDNRQFGYIAWTNWTGELIETGSRTWDSYGIAYWVWDPEVAAALGVDTTRPELDILHARVELIDCNTYKFSIDLWAGYFSFNPETIKPFVTQPDIDWLQLALPPGETELKETYYRLPTACPGCPFPSNGAMSGFVQTMHKRGAPAPKK